MRSFLIFFKIIFVNISITSVLILSSCHKEGNGGKSSVNGYVSHHGHKIGNSIVYIKYGAVEFPGADVTKYEASVTADVDGRYEFKNLRKGLYFLYAVGYDNLIMETVTGGTGVKLKYNKAETTDIPVIE
ncbi:MAG: hypothetical protein K8R85_01380 [Bacteroidetes bacterium]|nr:hypothetical protein [Bacteroidota bacterium]